VVLRIPDPGQVVKIRSMCVLSKDQAMLVWPRLWGRLEPAGYQTRAKEASFVGHVVATRTEFSAGNALR
jgi:hypothetical protein